MRMSNAHEREIRMLTETPRGAMRLQMCTHARCTHGRGYTHIWVLMHTSSINDTLNSAHAKIKKFIFKNIFSNVLYKYKCRRGYNTLKFLPKLKE